MYIRKTFREFVFAFREKCFRKIIKISKVLCVKTFTFPESFVEQVCFNPTYDFAEKM
jgi:hypothetical protein